LVAAGLAERVEIQVSYAIGMARPLSIMLETFGTGFLPDSHILELVEQHFDFRPAAIIRNLDLQRPIYRKTAAYGAFGRQDIDAPWEQTDKVPELRLAAEGEPAVTA
jgi:S-adenosylmethionine synthetase